MITTTTKSRDRIIRLLSNDAPIKWIFTGDSITHGVYDTFGHRDYPEHFAERIRWEKGRKRDSVITTAVSGWRITDLAEDLEWSVQQYAPQVVSLNFGMNDCVEGPEGVSKFKEVYREVLSRIRQANDTAFILNTPNAIYHTPNGLRGHLALYAGAIREIAVEYDAVLVDHEKDWLETAKRQTLLYWLADEIHPNEYGHRAMVRTLLRELNLLSEESVVCRLLVP